MTADYIGEQLDEFEQSTDKSPNDNQEIKKNDHKKHLEITSDCALGQTKTECKILKIT